MVHLGAAAERKVGLFAVENNSSSFAPEEVGGGEGFEGFGREAQPFGRGHLSRRLGELVKAISRLKTGFWTCDLLAFGVVLNPKNVKPETYCLKGRH